MVSCTPLLSERRLQPRAPCNLALLLYLGSDIWEATAHNICTRGLALAWDQAVEPDTRLTAEVLNPLDHFWHRKRLRIVHVTPQGENLWILGGIFVQEFTAEELEALLTQTPEHAHALHA